MSDEARATPFHCPYCGETGIRPGEAPRTYHCPTCDRRFSLAYLGSGSGAAEPAPGRTHLGADPSSATRGLV